jgi:hypothetical protein
MGERRYTGTGRLEAKGAQRQVTYDLTRALTSRIQMERVFGGSMPAHGDEEDNILLAQPRPSEVKDLNIDDQSDVFLTLARGSRLHLNVSIQADEFRNFRTLEWKADEQ